LRDFNYFEPYLKVQAKPKSRNILIVLLAALVLALIVYYQFYLIMQTRALKADIAEVDQYINSEETIKKVSEITDKQNKEAALTLAYTDLNAVAMSIEQTDKLDEMFMDQVNAQIPEGVFISDFNANNEFLTLKGYSTNYYAIAQIAYNLRNSGGFSDVTIPSVTEDNSNYIFLINATIAGEGQYAN
jgi:Tfp pilus assembly protein PilN